MKGEVFMLKRVIAAALAATCALSFTGCKKETDKQAEAGKTFTYWVGMPAGASMKYKSLAEMDIYKKRAEDSGVKIEFVHPPAGQENEQFNLMLASRDLTDIIEYNYGAYRAGKDTLIDDGILIKLDDIIENHAPNLKKRLEENENYKRLITTPKGAYYMFPSLNTDNYRIFGGLMVREDWLKEFGLDAPETIADWEEMLRAFKTKDGVTAPFTANGDMFWMEGTTTNTFNGAFDACKGKYVEDGKIKFGPIEPAYKEYITLLNRWYNEGLIDKDFSTNSGSAVGAKIINGEAGAVWGWIGGGMGGYMKALQEKDPSYSLIGVDCPKLNDDSEPVRFVTFQGDVSHYAAGISTACKDPEGAAEWLDYWYSDEGIMLSNFGIEGETYEMKDGHPVYTEKITNNPEGLSVSEAMGLSFRPADNPGVHQLEDYLMGFYQYPQQRDALKLWEKSTDRARTIEMLAITPSAENSEEAAALDTEIRTYVEENSMKFVNGTRPLSEYDDFVATLKKMNVDRYIEIYQEAYDEYMAK